MTDNNSKSPTSPWMPYLRPSTTAAKVLYCFHHAGGAASAFLRWAQALAEDVELRVIQMPGREARLGENRHESLTELVTDVVNNVDFDADSRPFALFGHSLGARLAFEVARSLRRKGTVHLPLHLMVSGGRAPSVPRREAPTFHLPDSDFIEKLSRYEGISQAVLDNRELLEIVTPILRADVKIVETATFTPEPPLNIPITALGGLGDKEVLESDLDEWENHTTQSFRKAMFTGGHFYLWDPEQEPEVLQLVRDTLAAN